MYLANLMVTWKKAAVLLPFLGSFDLAGADNGCQGTESLIPQDGHEGVIPTWRIQSTAEAGGNLAKLSRPGLDVSTWHDIQTSRCTLMGCLLHEGKYDDKNLFFSENLKQVDQGQFLVPWLYRHEFRLRDRCSKDTHHFLETNGVTSKADIFFNGNQVADRTVQAGSYVGRTYDISDLVEANNALVIQVYPTDYNYDLALGFVDWNPYPPDNGTGVWRDVVVRQTGPVYLGPLHIGTELELPAENAASATVTVKAVVQNLEDTEVTAKVEAVVDREQGGHSIEVSQSVTLRPKEEKEISMSVTVEDADIWWPKQWGDQPLYVASLSCSVDGEVSDSGERSFGIRTATSKLNSHTDTLFEINGHPFQVLGGGYSADMFLRWDGAKFTTQVQYMMDMGLNTLRLEGKMEQPELYDIADRMGLMVMAGWECCDKWEAWTYNNELGVDPVPWWDDADYQIANMSMRHEASMMQSHPSMLAFLVGSDFWPDDEATAIYVDAIEAANWDIPIISSASQRGFPEALGNSGMKMYGPYDWVPPNYWYDKDEQLGAAFGFGSEQGAGVGTPEIGSLAKFLTEEEMDDIWKEPDAGLYHMSTEVSQFYDRAIYNKALRARFGVPDSLTDYLLKAQMMDYEATRSEFEAYAIAWSAADRPATGLIYWMLNNAWPSLHWNLFDYYMRPAGSFYGAKVAGRIEHVAYDYVDKAVYLINRSLDRTGTRSVRIELIDSSGKELAADTLMVDTEPNTSSLVRDISAMLSEMNGDVAFLRLVLDDANGNMLSRNVYWIAKEVDELDWEGSDWFYTPVTKYADYTSLSALAAADVSITPAEVEENKATVILENMGSTPAVFVRLNLVDEDGNDILPVYWSDNYVTLWPKEKLELEVSWEGSVKGRVEQIEVSGANVKGSVVNLRLGRWVGLGVLLHAAIMVM